ncbi:MAG TPA: DALR anticodon-binding domain-containing protein, partial [Vicinamibacterales bacterium]|nr:DALR anticodon-binding domain-containing protein [Vicinamibacterales bacterium]
RRQAQGIVKILADLPAVTGINARVGLWRLVERAAAPWTLSDDARQAVSAFLRERVLHLFEQRGFDLRTIRAVVQEDLSRLDVLEARKTLDALTQMTGSDALLGVAALLKRVKNITKGVAAPPSLEAVRRALREPAEQALASELDARAGVIRAAADRGDYREAFTAIAALQPAVAKFFDDVLVMAEEPALRDARLGLVASLRDLILGIADISEIVTDSQ